MFIVEARRRAAIEAECEAGAEIIDNGQGRDDEGGSSDSSIVMTGDNRNNSRRIRKKTVEIRADHIAKIAAELLLDLS